MPSAGAQHASLVVVANRLPITRVEDAGAGKWVTSPGGLVSALKPAMTDLDGVAWLGWTGEQTDSTLATFEHDGLRLVPIALSEQEHQLHYEGMSNSTLWPLYHGKIEPPEFHRHWFDGYRKVNHRFATAAAEAAAPGALVWIHDYQLQLVPGMLRELRPDLRIGFFLHIPFPSPELFMQLPWRNELVTAMLGADLLGFQAPADATNFHRLARALGLATRSGSSGLEFAHRAVNVRSFPIGIDYQRYHHAALEPDVLEQSRTLRSQLGDPDVVLLGVDRLDYTKGIDLR
ncbi:MAG: trehalose-6-phosphate synthase, partial [Actinomycetota bacterium]|nr:trehalose-6-phosphate synthase [Actinomycetota bacterium]